MLTYGFAKKILIKKNWRQKRDFCCFSMTLKTVIFVLVQIQTLIFCKNRGYFCVYWVSKFEVLSSELWKLIVKAMFARLRKLQFFKAVESCTGGYGRFRCQRVKQKIYFSYCWQFWFLNHSNKKPWRLATYHHYFIWKQAHALRSGGEGTSCWPLFSARVKVAWKAILRGWWFSKLDKRGGVSTASDS